MLHTYFIIAFFRILGFDKLMSFVVSEWVQDIKKNQLPNLIGGVGPMHSLVQLCMKYLFCKISLFLLGKPHLSLLLYLLTLFSSRYT